ncbi:uncharacterized protein MELLADRAFT_105255 [Melampsora larici-populina 98AG31]|uniref:ATPase AAA-type core domain-containing protein n=1 Tax=Melampsora larici-populina (strain 98AG31 / pathotype 3-4-7) TaxID=747676 RepID=F4RHD0_MELLP|nr:uncharacterized protein MELLADRAFT_105255 [Melampsora larici-populina 98AG31]EGG08243.1 hypothetical protein MELLADRAFT_105255 [Melampsora larici-populina 98AG31]
MSQDQLHCFCSMRFDNCGPLGTGNTLLTKALDKFLFNSGDAICRIDGSEYSEKHSVSRLIGSPPGYVGREEGGTFTEWVRRKPYSIVLIDEIEKASREFTELFLQVLDDGRLTDSQGRVVSFRNCLIVMTSNLGAVYLNETPEDGPVPESAKILVHSAICAHFAPEFSTSLDQHKSDQLNVRLAEIQKRLYINGKDITLEVDDKARDSLGLAGFNPQYEERIRDGEVAMVTADWRANQILIRPNHDATSMDIDGEIDGLEDDDIKIEEVD